VVEEWEREFEWVLIGGAAVFFAKESSKVEIINNTNGGIVIFYEVLKQDFPTLEKYIPVSLYGGKRHAQARVTYENPDMFDRVKRS
jgi:DNA adenine methylase